MKPIQRPCQGLQDSGGAACRRRRAVRRQQSGGTPAVTSPASVFGAT
jgi:hypothetical protein